MLKEVNYDILKIPKDKPGSWFAPVAKKQIIVPYGMEFNRTYASEHGYETLVSTPVIGGIIVQQPGDFVYVHCTYNYDTNIREFVYTRLATWLNEEYSLNAKFEDNDLIIDDTYKVSGAGQMATPPTIYVGFHFSMSVNIIDISNISNKTMKKIPKGLYDYNVSKEDLLLKLSQIEQEYIEYEKQLGFFR